MKKTRATPYDWNVICMVCREKIKASESTKRWDGLIVGANHPGCFEYRSPLDMPAPPLRDQRPLPFTSPEPPDTFTFTGTSHDITVTASPFTYQAGTQSEQILITNGTIQALYIDGQALPWEGASSYKFLVHPRTTVQVNYTVAPTMTSTY